MGIFGKKIPKDLVKRILDCIVEGNTYLVVPSFVFLVRTNYSFHLDFDKYFKRSLFLEACVYGRHNLVQLGIVESPHRGRIITQDLVDTAFLITCAQDQPSIEVLRVLLLAGGADINAQWDPDYRRLGHKEQLDHPRKKKKRRKKLKRYLSRYTSGRCFRKFDTALILACRKRSFERRTRETTSHLIKVVAFLKLNGADCLLENEAGHDPMTVAIDTSFFRVLFEQHEWLDPTCKRLLSFLNSRKLNKKVDDTSFLLLLGFAFETKYFLRDLKKRCCQFLEEWKTTLDQHEIPSITTSAAGTCSSVEEVVDDEEWEDPDELKEKISKFKKKMRKERKKRIKNVHRAHDFIMEMKNRKNTPEDEKGRAEKGQEQLDLDRVPEVPSTNTSSKYAVAIQNVLNAHCVVKNWVGSSSLIDADRCRITQNELVPFIAFLLLDAAQRGIMPCNRWTQQFDSDLATTLRSLKNVKNVCAFLRERCVPLLSVFVRHDIFRFPKLLLRAGQEVVVGWSELLPLIQSLYCLMWRASKGEHPGIDEFVSAELDRDIVKKRAEDQVHYYLKLQNVQVVETIAPLPLGWKYMQDVTGGYYSNNSSRKTSMERPTIVGRSFA